MTEDAGFDPDTGELPLLSISEAAIAAARSPQEPVPQDLYAALHKAVAVMPVWITTDKPGAHKIKYATLKAILDVVRPKLMENGIRIRQGSGRSYSMDDGGGVKGRLVMVYTDLVHGPSGQVDRTEVEIPIIRLDAQAMGSAITYGRRYSLLAALGLATDEADDDGEDAKLKDVHEMVPDSPALIALKAGMDKIKDASKLTEWVSEAQQKKQFSMLSEQELERARAHYAARGKAILAGDDMPAPTKKVKAAE